MNVLVTGGGTIAPIDDVRTITNVSSGRFASHIAESCVNQGATVWHIHAPAALLPFRRQAQLDLDATYPIEELARLTHLRRHWAAVRDRLHLVPLRAGTVAEYSETLHRILTTQPIDIAFLAMAVSDYEPEPATGKLPSDEDELIIRCRRTPKVIHKVRDWAPSVYLVGFKLLSRVSDEELVRRAEEAGLRNRADLMVANDLQTVVAGLHTVHLVRPGQPPEALPPGPDLADRLVDRVLEWSRA